MNKASDKNLARHSAHPTFSNNKPIRILHAVSQMDRGGIENLLMNIYRTIDRTKVQFDFLDHATGEGAFDREIYDLGGKIFKLNKLSRSYFLQYGRDLKHFFSEHHEYTIIHSHLNLLSAFTLKYAAASDVSVRIAHSHTNMLLNTGLKKLVKIYAKKIINKYTTHRFACSKEAAVWQFGQSDYDSGNVTIIPNGIALEKFAFSEVTRVRLRKELGIGENTFVIGHSGSFTPVKNHRFLLNVFKAVYTKDNTARLLLVGDGPLKDEIIKQASDLGILNCIIFTGSVGNVYDYLCAMDAFIFPSLFEGLGMSAVEAQTSGLPCFLSDTISHDAVISEKCSVLPLGDEATWASKISETMQKSRQGTPSRLCPKDSTKFDIKIITKQLEDFYLKIYFGDTNDANNDSSSSTLQYF